MVSGSGTMKGAPAAGTLARLAAWAGARGRWARGGIAMLAGATMTLGHAPVDLPWGFFLAVPVLVWLIDAAPSGRAVLWTGWCAGFGYFVTGLHWIGYAFLVDADRFFWLMPFAVTLMPTGLGLFWAAGAWLARRAWVPGPARAAALAAALTLAEFARGHVLTGLPWGLPGYVWGETPVMQMASWAGPWGMTFLTLFLTGLPLVALAGRRHRVWPGLAALAVLAGFWGAGTLRVPAETAYAPDAPLIRIVQPNAEQALKWVKPWAGQFYARLLELSVTPGEVRPDVVIWPETAVAFLPAYEAAERARIAATGGVAATLIGALHAVRADGRDVFYNSLFALGPDGEILDRYDKHHLVPFGEYVPLAPLLRRLGITEIAGRGMGFESGPGPALVKLPELPAFAPLICYELIFPDEVIPVAGRPDWLLQITNDAWFGNYAGPQQHLAQARIRAIEFGLPVVRAANTGISAIIDPYGRLVATIGLNTVGIIDGKLPAKVAATTYGRIGDLPLVSLCVIIWIFLIYYRNIPGSR